MGMRQKESIPGIFTVLGILKNRTHAQFGDKLTLFPSNMSHKRDCGSKKG